MENNNHHQHNLSRLLDFFVPTIAFCLAGMILLQTGDSQLLLQALVYASVIWVALHLGRSLLRLLIGPVKRVPQLMLGNALGMGLGTILVTPMTWLMPQFFSLASIVVASILTFFVLGTLSPLVNQNNRASMRRSVA